MSRVLSRQTEARDRAWSDPMPEDGVGVVAALDRAGRARAAGGDALERAAVLSFRDGWRTPAALGADWLTSAYDQVAYAWASSPFAARAGAGGGRLAAPAVRASGRVWRSADDRRDDGELRRAGGGAQLVGVSSTASMSRPTASAKLPPPLILSSGYLHPSAVQAIGMLGLGRANIRRLARDDVGRLDLDGARARAGRRLDGPAIVIANAGEVNAGDFDPIAEIAELCERHSAWLHVDGAFGLFARLARHARAHRRCRAGRLGHLRRPQVAERALRLRLRVRARDRAAAARAQRRRAVPAVARRPAPELRLPVAGELAPRPRAGGLGDAARVRTRWLPGDGRAARGARATPGRPGGRRSRARAAGGCAAQHRLLPGAPAGPRRGRSSTISTPARCRAARRRTRVCRHDHLRRQGRASARRSSTG